MDQIAASQISDVAYKASLEGYHACNQSSA